MHIFVIDDEKAICDIVQRVLKAKGHTVEAFSSRCAAILALNAGRPNGLITDFDLDTGTCQSIIELAIAKSVSPIVVMSGNPDNECRLPKRALFLAKPIDMKAIEALFPTG